MDAYESFVNDPTVCAELMAHCDGGYRKFLYVTTNVITKEVIFTVTDRLMGKSAEFPTLKEALDVYNKILSSV